jgi:type IV secretory pathway VirB2 component (pilin)
MRDDDMAARGRAAADDVRRVIAFGLAAGMFLPLPLLVMIAVSAASGGVTDANYSSDWCGVPHTLRGPLVTAVAVLTVAASVWAMARAVAAVGRRWSGWRFLWAVGAVALLYMLLLSIHPFDGELDQVGCDKAAAVLAPQ